VPLEKDQNQYTNIKTTTSDGNNCTTIRNDPECLGLDDQKVMSLFPIIRINTLILKVLLVTVIIVLLYAATQSVSALTTRR